MIVAQTPVPVVPCYIRGAFEALAPGRRLPRPRKISLRLGWPLDFASVSNDREGWAAIAVRVEAAVRKLAQGPNETACASAGHR